MQKSATVNLDALHHPDIEHAHAAKGGYVNWNNPTMCECQILFKKNGSPFVEDDFTVPAKSNEGKLVREDCETKKPYKYKIKCQTHPEVDPDVIIDR